MKKASTFLLAFIFISLSVYSQEERTVMVEHFTNTNCGICGTRNPDLLNNLRDHNPEVIHIAYYPSKPYADCKLHLHNSDQNDSRTKYYDIYGSTPRVIIQGENAPRANFKDENLYDDYKGQNSDYSIKTLYQRKDDKILTRVTLTSMTSTQWEDLLLQVVLVEDTVYYKGRNSEDHHPNVFRKALTDVNGDDISQEVAEGDSLVFTYQTAYHKDWDKNRMYAIAWLQDAETKEILQAKKGSKGPVDNITGLNTKAIKTIQPHIQNGTLSISSEYTGSIYQIYSVSGQLMTKGNLSTSGIPINALKSGVYFINVENANGVPTRGKFIVR